MRPFTIKLRWKIACWAFVLFSAVFAVARGETNAISSSLRELEKTLKSVREELSVARKDAQKKNDEYYRFEHEIVYTNALAAKLYKDIKDLEKRLTQKREELNNEIMMIPEMREIIAQRNAVFEKKRKLEERDALLRDEIGKKRAAEAAGR